MGNREILATASGGINREIGIVMQDPQLYSVDGAIGLPLFEFETLVTIKLAQYHYSRPMFQGIPISSPTRLRN